MDGFQLFRKLGFGAKFDLKRFHNDAAKLKIISTKKEEPKNPLQEQLKSVERVKSIQGKRRSEDLEHTSPKKKKKQIDESEESSDESEKDEESDESDEDSKKGTSDDSDSEETEELSDMTDKSDEEKSSDVDTSSDEETSDEDQSDSETELQLLGNIKSSGKEDNTEQERNKKKKKEKRKLDAAQRKLKAKRKKQKIHVTGTDVPPPLMSFEDLRIKYGLHKTLMQNIQDVGYKEPTPIQLQAIPVMLQRRDIMACAPTGSGKTAAFIIPILHHLKEPRNLGFRALVLAPTRELATQTHREFVRLSEGIGFRTFYIEKASTAVKKFGPKSKKKFDILVTTPNRLVYILQKHPDIIDLSSVEWLVVDESDKLFEEGKRGFRDQLGVIYKACDSTHVRRAMFSATFACDVEDWCKLNLDNVVQVYVGLRNSATETIQQELVFVGSESGKLLAVRQLIQQRDNVVKCFRLGKIWVLICTELMGRGIDFKGVNLVINYDFPYSAISYIHRIGRTGRAGRPGRAITYFTQDDSVYLRSIANVMQQAGCEVPQYMLKLARPSKKKRKKLAHRAPRRKPISTKSVYDKEEERKQKKERMETIYTRKPRKEKPEAVSGEAEINKGKKGAKKPNKHKHKKFQKESKSKAQMKES